MPGTHIAMAYAYPMRSPVLICIWPTPVCCDARYSHRYGLRRSFAMSGTHVAMPYARCTHTMRNVEMRCVFAGAVRCGALREGCAVQEMAAASGPLDNQTVIADKVEPDAVRGRETEHIVNEMCEMDI
eukprot:3498659-Rhodomonas_salina.2